VRVFGKGKFAVDVTTRDEKRETYCFKTKREMRAFIWGLSAIGWRSYAFDETIKVKAKP
jgi:hypothetical protein